MPILYQQTLYNCRVFVLNSKILLIRPKLFLAEGNNYRESRWFTPWLKEQGWAVEDFKLPSEIQTLTGQKSVPFGNAILELNDAKVAHEICEEIFTAVSPHVLYNLLGVDIIGHGSGSHHELRKLQNRLDRVKGVTLKHAGVYAYTNLIGCDGSRLYFDGCSMINMNAATYAQAP